MPTATRTTATTIAPSTNSMWSPDPASGPCPASISTVARSRAPDQGADYAPVDGAARGTVRPLRGDTVSAGGRHADGPRGRDPWDDDDLDAAFGPDTASMRARSRPERVRAGTAVVLGAVAVAVVLVVVLAVILSGVQRGVGGVFPQPDADRARFVAAASVVPGVDAVERARSEKTSFAGYDVTALVRADPQLGAEDRRALVSAVSSAAADASGSGVRIWADVDFGEQQVGVSDSEETSQRRLRMAGRLDAIGGVVGVSCTFASRPDGRSDEAAAQAVTVRSAGQGVGFAAVAAAAEQVGDEVFPGVQVRTVTP